MYTANIENGDQYTFVVMNSVFPGKASQFISEMFDLKGSTVGRECSAKERQENQSHFGGSFVVEKTHQPNPKMIAWIPLVVLIHSWMILSYSC